MRTVREITEIITEHRLELEKHYKVKDIGLFGSYTRDQQKETSDLDVLVDFEEPVSLLGLVRAENYLSELLGIKVDLVPRKDIRPELKESILKETVYL
ncbi:MAG: nucleotidyltransferase family protein [Methanosarcinaceae archaeon]|nr:nucleotidyltransferase family protein [Methanosarcinaceae archaeon]